MVRREDRGGGRGRGARAAAGALSPRGASPGLLTRRYSVPETIMRKYKLAQQNTETDECAPSVTSRASSPVRPPVSAATRAPPPPHLDRELMRRSALMRRLWGRPGPAAPSASAAALAPCDACTCRGARSLDGSAQELRVDWAIPTRTPLTCLPQSDTDDKEYFSDCTYQSHRARPAPALAAAPVSATDVGSLGPGPTSPGVHAHIDLHFDESSEYMENDDVNLNRAAPPAPHPPPTVPAYSTLEAPSPPYELLEIVVSETVNSSFYEESSPHDKLSLQSLPAAPRILGATPLGLHGVELDQYVSDILVSSLNSLSDQLEQVSASLGRGHGREHRLCILEKEIKVKLQNAGVNTIVHLSPTSNHQIIFGNEELCHRDERDVCNNASPPSVSSSPSPRPVTPSTAPADESAPRDHNHNESSTHESVNRAVLHQIQKLFQEELSSLPPPAPTAPASSPPAPPLLVEEERSDVDEYLQRVGAGNYAPELVPRLLAMPATDSMEVNTSSSSGEEHDPPSASDCTSLVDSLDDPRSPRYLPQLSTQGHRRRDHHLVRSTIDVLDLLPETAPSSSSPALSAPAAPAPPLRESEAFFVRIGEDSLACSPAPPPPPRLPDRIRQRLARRQRRRDLRAECATPAPPAVTEAVDADRQRRNAAVRARRRLDRDCLTLLNTLLDELIAKIAQDEYRYMRIKHRPTETPRVTASVADHCKRNWKRSAESLDELESFKVTRHGAVRFRKLEHEASVRGRLALRPAPRLLPAPAPAARRVYHKSEIHEGSKRIEILEILEYAEPSQSSLESSTSESSSSRGVSQRRSRIPVPVPMPMAAPGRTRAGSEPSLVQCGLEPSSPPRRRASVPASDGQERSLPVPARFRQMFDIIPEERSSLSLESSTSEGASHRHCGTSPPPVPPPPPRRHQLTMTSPLRRSAGTSPPAPAPAPASLWTRAEGSNENPVTNVERIDTERTSRSASTQCEPESADGRRPAAGRTGERPAGRLTLGKENNNTNTKTIKRDRIKLISQRVGKRMETRMTRSPPAPPPSPPVPPLASPPPPARSRSSSSESSSSSLLCALAPRWLTSRRRPRTPHRAPADNKQDHVLKGKVEERTKTKTESVGSGGGGGGDGGAGAGGESGGQAGWSVTLCGGARTALPRDVEMRLRFPTPAGSPRAPAPAPAPAPALPPCPCRHCVTALPAPPPAATLTLRNHSTDSSVIATKSTRKSAAAGAGSVGGVGALPDLETFRASRTRTKRSVKTRRACSLHCWLPPSAHQPLRCSKGLSVLGCGIVPELRPTRRRP